MMMDSRDMPEISVNEPRVALSVPEVDSLCMRAARGAGYSWGLSEECGHAMAWLASHGFDWAPALLRRLTGDRGAEVVPAPGAWAGNGPMCPLRAGVTLADFAALPEGPGPAGVALGIIHDPLLVLPFAARAARTTGGPLDCRLDGVLWATVDGRSVRLARPELNAALSSRLELRPAILASPGRVPSAGATAVITAEAYARLSEIALRMTVPATATSEARAGGTGSDND